MTDPRQGHPQQPGILSHPQAPQAPHAPGQVPHANLQPGVRPPGQPQQPQPVRPMGQPGVGLGAQPQIPRQVQPMQQPQMRPGGVPHAPQHAPHAPSGPVDPLVRPRGPGGPVDPLARPQQGSQQGEEPLTLLEDESDGDPSAPSTTPSKRIIAFGAVAAQKKHDWKRKCTVTGTGACRVKSFHSKYSDQGIEHMDDMINEWLDAHPEVEIKFVTPTVAVFEGKIREPALVLNCWY